MHPSSEEAKNIFQQSKEKTNFRATTKCPPKEGHDVLSCVKKLEHLNIRKVNEDQHVRVRFWSWGAQGIPEILYQEDVVGTTTIEHLKRLLFPVKLKWFVNDDKVELEDDLRLLDYYQYFNGSSKSKVMHLDVCLR